MDSSPRFRSTNSDNNSTYPSNNNNSPTKLRLMCSNGGHIVPRPHDKSLCYVGGETRMVAVDRHTTLLDLTRRLSQTLFRSSSSSTATSPPPPPPPSSFTLKYQLPLEDLDSLISVTTDEDLENMIDEYERLNERSNSSSRLRLFVFPTNPESVSSIGSFLENPVKSEDWFLNALNGTNSGFSDTSSVNCLLDLDDEIRDKKDVSHKGTTNLISGNNNSGQDIHSIPDSPWMETTTTTTSSFGSASSTPSIANLPPIRVNGGDDYSKNIVGGGGIEEEVFQIGVQKRDRKEDHDAGGLMGSPAPVAVSGSPTAIQEVSDPFLSYQERSEQGLQMSYVKRLHHQQQQNQSTGFDLASMDSILSDLSITEQSSPVSQTQSSSYNNRTHDQITGTHNSARLSPMPTTQVDSPRHQLHYQQPQFIPPLQYIHHHHHPSPPVPAATPYYHHHPPMDQQNFMYYIPATQPPQGYNFPFQQPQPSHADHTTPAAATPVNQAAMKTEFPVYRTTRSGAGGPQLVRVQSGYQNQQPQHVGYSEIHQQAQTQSVYYATQGMPRLAAPQYQNMMLVSPVETNLQEQQVRTAQPRQDR